MASMSFSEDVVVTSRSRSQRRESVGAVAGLFRACLWQKYESLVANVCIIHE